jgi:hypothetical protein
VERVVFEPDEVRAERIQVWGAFAYVDGGAGSGSDVSAAAKGYLYFTVPKTAGLATTGEIANVRREWADLEAVAGTGQVVGFGQWVYFGKFGGLRPDAPRSGLPYIIARAGPGGTHTEMRVRPASEPPASPAIYLTNAGIVTLQEHGSHAAIVSALREALRR